MYSNMTSIEVNPNQANNFFALMNNLQNIFLCTLFALYFINILK